MFNLDTIKETLSHIKMEHKLDQNEKRVMSFAILTLGLLEDMTGSIEAEAQDTSSIATKEPHNTTCLSCGRTFYGKSKPQSYSMDKECKAPDKCPWCGEELRYNFIDMVFETTNKISVDNP